MSLAPQMTIWDPYTLIADRTVLTTPAHACPSLEFTDLELFVPTANVSTVVVSDPVQT